MNKTLFQFSFVCFAMTALAWFIFVRQPAQENALKPLPEVSIETKPLLKWTAITPRAATTGSTGAQARTEKSSNSPSTLLLTSENPNLSASSKFTIVRYPLGQRISEIVRKTPATVWREKSR